MISVRKFYFFIISLLLLTIYFSAEIGPLDTSLLDLVKEPSSTIDEINKDTLLHVRLPRIFLGLIVGLALSICGASMQGLFRNPLADPGLIGITSGAALSVGVVIVLFPTLLNGLLGLYALSIAAFIGAMVTALIITIIATKSNQLSIVHVLLCGIAINSIAGALTGLLNYFADESELQAFIFWTMGNIDGSEWNHVIMAGTMIIPCLFILIRSSIGLNLLSLGEEPAVYVGLNYHKLKIAVLISVSIAVGSCVAVSGFIGFIGLVVPHIIRQFVSPDHKVLLPLSALTGATLLLISDLLAKIIIAPQQLPVGLITSIIGGPIFLFIVIKQFSRR